MRIPEKPSRWILILLPFFCLCQPGWAEPGLSAITQPSADITLSFLQAGRIQTEHVQEGQAVTAGQALLSQYDALERVQLAKMEELSRDLTRVEAAEAQLAQKKTDLQKMEWAGQRGAISELDIEHAKLDVTIAELSLSLAKLEHQQIVHQYEEAKLKVENMHLSSPIDGFVEMLAVRAGESVQALDDAIRIVRTDPLWVDVRIPLTMAYSVGPGDSVQVEFPQPQASALTGHVIFVARAGDAASDTLRTRIEVPNPKGRPSGERVTVTFLPASLAKSPQPELTDPATEKQKKE